MNKIAVVYFSGTGNTEMMANAIADGVGEKGVKADVFAAEDFSASMMDDYDVIAFGCPAMGDEELEDSVFLPMFEPCRAKLNGKQIALFGSYDWGDGEWLRNWEQRCRDDGAVIAADSLKCNLTPDDTVTTQPNPDNPDKRWLSWICLPSSILQGNLLL